MWSEKQLTKYELSARQEEAIRLGKEAFHLGIKGTPISDERLKPLWEGASTHQHTLISLAWTNGWNKEYMAQQSRLEAEQAERAEQMLKFAKTCRALRAAGREADAEAFEQRMDAADPAWRDCI